MKISTKGRYGLMLMVDLAVHDDGQPVSLKSVAERQGLSEHYLEQLILPLRNAGFVRSVRGAYGGYQLTKAASDISVLDLFSLLEGPLQFAEKDIEDGLGQLWTRMEQALQSVLGSLSLADLVSFRQSDEHGYMFYI
ncbi:RrF2 family transcriptional regulator [Alicyclobacillus tolerans]|uniref:RrF2 family transcriptional regulator n=1 Tax=Alicyclobacillus tolerans TaxID=90970 RepID=UPI003B787EC1